MSRRTSRATAIAATKETAVTLACRLFAICAAATSAWLSLPAP
ncbi:hypothetical protein [Ferirhizobium litorale]|nr:hypothetical protein [Fererhizobium litorale]